MINDPAWIDPVEWYKTNIGINRLIPDGDPAEAAIWLGNARGLMAAQKREIGVYRLIDFNAEQDSGWNKLPLKEIGIKYRERLVWEKTAVILNDAKTNAKPTS